MADYRPTVSSPMHVCSVYTYDGVHWLHRGVLKRCRADYRHRHEDIRTGCSVVSRVHVEDTHGRPCDVCWLGVWVSCGWCWVLYVHSMDDQTDSRTTPSCSLLVLFTLEVSTSPLDWIKCVTPEDKTHDGKRDRPSTTRDHTEAHD